MPRGVVSPCTMDNVGGDDGGGDEGGGGVNGGNCDDDAVKPSQAMTSKNVVDDAGDFVINTRKRMSE